MNNTETHNWLFRKAGLFTVGMQNMLGKHAAVDPRRLQSAVADIRESMLDCLTHYGKDATSLVHLRISYAKDIQDLWYLRGDVMAVIASADGEVVAKDKLSEISVRFKGLLPKGLVTRPSPLGF